MQTGYPPRFSRWDPFKRGIIHTTKRVNIMSNNIKKNVRNIKKATSETITFGTDGLALATGAVAATPACIKHALLMPFKAAEQYLMDAHNMDQETAHTVSHKWVDQDMTQTIDDVGAMFGTLAAAAVADDDEDKEDLTKLTKAQLIAKLES